LRDLNKVTLIGRLVRDVEARELNSGTRVANFALANNYSKKVGDHYEDAVSFIDCEAFRGWEQIEQYLTKGKQVAIEGSLRQDRWEDKEGNKRNKIKILVDSIQLLGGQGNGEANGSAPSPSTPSSSEGQMFNDDIPF
jgi:single-strand DNA-binding protein